MSAAHNDTHGHGDHGEGHGAGHGSMRDYLIGFFLSVVLTAIPFWLVMNDVIADKGTTAVIIMVFAAVQVVVHMIYFLHMNGKAEGGWTLMAMLFTILLVVIVLVGSMWVMYHLNTNMMPVHQMPSFG
ncbi:MAG: cytochrome o ubiquinol oxidase subunit IV [Sphingomonadales bacterium]|nr:MAG: cytochrome o ubiquinol oxidase subunit IV [Sphingomonadales bacterium]TNF02398.1 MAG: cytochrome o ubiquinol oxidase subunit IV [Sphingomonadales bacterium]